MKLSIIKMNGVLYPFGEQSQEDITKLKDGHEYVINVTLKRNHKFHRKAFALFRTIFDNQDYFTDQDIFRKYLIMKAGRVITINTPKGVMFLPESISYEKMEQDEFEKLFNAIITFSVNEYGSDENMLNQIMNFA